ncbi:MAG: hypothetical protein M3R47_17165 [Chloroflexota bacterium]|nr:hypothetical protein [Chloroflexota bacterium]
MTRAFSIIGQAFRLWWQEFMLLIFFNLIWLALQIPIITGPPATAAMYVIARQIADGELIEPRHGLNALRRMFAPAWIWGALNLPIVGVLIGNFWLYQSPTGWLWTGLRLVWGVIALGWFSVNLFYWPFWLAQEQHSLQFTFRNSFLFLAKQPGLALTLMLMSALLIVVSVLTTLPLASALMAWLALIGVLAVEEALHPHDEDDSAVIEPIQ